MRQTSSGTRLDLALGDVASDFDVILCDVWGVIHNGVRHHRSAVEALQAFRSAGGTVVLLTNAPAPAAQVRRRLDALLVPHDAYDAIATSGDVTVSTIVEAGCPPLFGIGPLEESALFEEAGRLGPRKPARVPIESAELVICIGLDETGDRPEAYDPMLRQILARRLDLVCANPDLVVEMGDTLVFCAGAIADRYAAMGGRVVQAGKPYSAIYALALSLARRARGSAVAADRVLAIGDAVRTDLIGARDMGYASIFVTTGIHRGALHLADGAAAIDVRALDDLLRENAVTPIAALARLDWKIRPPQPR